MTTTLLNILKINFQDALSRMAGAVGDCPDELWQTDLWPRDASGPQPPDGALGGSAPWFLAYHALSCLDYDLSGDFEPWAPPPPFDENVWSWPKRVFTKEELLAYIDYCRGRAHRTLEPLTEDAAARPLPETHRYRGAPYGVVIGNIPLHVTEHAAQIRQFFTLTGAERQARA
jgi:hypothetical protein